MKLSLTKESLEVIHKDAIDSFPNECCGFFYGIDEELRHIELASPVINSKKGDKRRRFEISGYDYMMAEKKALELGLTLQGIYHSHPLHPAVPSKHDLKQSVPFFSYIIVSVNENKIIDTRSWILGENGQFEEETIIDLNKVSTI